jgi:hypothetical protein
MADVLITVGGKPVYITKQEHVYWVGEFTVNADGSPRCYGPEGCHPKPLDYLANAGHEGNWWALATDNGESSGNPILQGEGDPYPGLYVSMTAYVVPGFSYEDPRRYLNSEKVLFSVVPGNVRKATQGQCKGSRCRVTDLKTGKQCECVIGDIGPSDHLGEGSIALAKFFGLNPDPKSGGSSDTTRFQFEMWPGIPAEGYELQ